MSRRRSADGGDRAVRERAKSAFYARLTDDRLFALIKRDDYLAYREFVSRYVPLLVHYAERAGIPFGELEDVAMELLNAAVIRFATTTVPLPASMARYLAKAFRHRFLNARRELARHERQVREAMTMAGEDVSAAAYSEGMLRASHGPDWEPAPLRPGVRRLGAMLDEELDPEEWCVVSWVSENVPQRLIAAWMGMPYDAFRKHLQRLREKLADALEVRAATFTTEEQRDVRHLFATLDDIADAS